MPDARVALLIDAENVGAGHFTSIRQQISTLGDVRIGRIFGDFSGGQLAPWVAIAKMNGLQAVLQLSGGKGKNSADMAMTIEAMDIVHAGGIDAICIVSSDRDFVPLVQRLRRGLLAVYGFGSAESDVALQSLCTRFFPLSRTQATPVAKVPPPEMTATSQTEAQKALQVIRQVTADPASDGWISLSAAGDAVRKAAPALAQSYCGKGKLLKNVRASGLFEVSGTGGAIRIRPKVRAVS